MKYRCLVAIVGLSICLTSCTLSSSKKEKTIDNGKCTLVFRTQQEITVYIYKPIDDTYNNWYISDKLDLKQNISINYKFDVNNFEFITCKFSDGDRRDFLVFPGDSINIIYDPKGIILSGSNAAGQNYYNYNFVDRGLWYFCDTLERHMNKYPINYDSLYYYFEKEVICPYQTDLKKMEKLGSITSAFSTILAKNLYFAGCTSLQMNYEQWIIFGNSKIKERPSQEDIRSILQQLSRIYDTSYAMSSEVKKMPYNNGSYWNLKYKYLDGETKEDLKKKCDFDNAPFLLLASDSLQLRYYGNELILDLQNGTTNYNHEKLLAYLSSKFPNSEYVAIAKKIMEQKQSSKVSDEIKIIDNSPSSIMELMQLPGIKGNYAYIDLWATWCMPCTQEFQYNDEIHEILAQYNNIVPVYISMDIDRKLWESRVSKFNLKGYNIMASKSLNENIGAKIYNEKQVTSIPRYLLLDPEGSIVNDNLPRPSKSAQLKQIFANILK